MSAWVEDVLRPALTAEAQHGSASSVMALAQRMTTGPDLDVRGGDGQRATLALLEVLQTLPSVQVESHELALPPDDGTSSGP